jgi:8-oxo-dGTP diphosphatase
MEQHSETESSEATRPPKRVVAALIRRGDSILICQRKATQAMALQWEFPGGKIEPGEGDVEALERELVEELDIQAQIGPLIAQVRHTYRNGNVVELKFFSVEHFEGELKNQIFEQIRWEKLVNLPQYDFLAADRGLVRDLAAGKLL